ncbi:MAG: glycosyltransferase [Dongiaceae bacterium]
MPSPPNTICFLRPPPERDQFGVLDAGTQVYAGAFVKQGFTARFLRTGKADTAKELTGLLKDPQIAAVYSLGGWGGNAMVKTRQGMRSAFAHFGKPLICHHGDYPFTPWVEDKVRRDFPGKFVFHNDTGTPDLVHRMMRVRGHHGHANSAYYDYRYSPEARAIPPKDRPIPLLYVGKHTGLSEWRPAIKQRWPDRLAMFEKIVERGIDDVFTPIWDITAAIMAEEGREFDLKDKATFHVLFLANDAIQSTRRERLLAKLVHHPVHIIVSRGEVPTLKHANAKYVKGQSFAEVLTLIEQSRAVVISQPNFSSGITERILTAMHRRAVVLSTTNGLIDQLFEADQHYLQLRPDFANLDEQVGRLADGHLTTRLSEQAWRTVARNHSPESVVAKYLATLRAADVAI